MSLFGKVMKTPVVTERLDLAEEDEQVRVIADEIGEQVRRLPGGSLHIREVDAGSCNGCELEISAMTNPYYDIERFGMHFVASPRHADCLIVAGPVTLNMADPLRRTYEATPEPKIVVAVGSCAEDCGLFKDAYAVAGPVSSIIPVDVVVPGCPPSPRAILAGILAALRNRESGKKPGQIQKSDNK